MMLIFQLVVKFPLTCCLTYTKISIYLIIHWQKTFLAFLSFPWNKVVNCTHTHTHTHTHILLLWQKKWQTAGRMQLYRENKERQRESVHSNY